MKIIRTIFCITILVCSIIKTNAQISPPGEGIAHTANWFAIGVRQKLDTLEGIGWQSMTYAGMGRKSNPDNFNPFHKSAILVLNQEFYHMLPKHWQYSFALSYRRQDEYQVNEPFEHKTPSIKQEFRGYGRLSYVMTGKLLKFIPTLRQEYRKFYDPSFGAINETYQFRTRFRSQLSINLTRNKTQKLILGSEQLFSTSKKQTADHLSKFTYQESRFTCYYSLAPSHWVGTINIGYMNNWVVNGESFDAHYLAVDFIFENPMRLRKKS